MTFTPGSDEGRTDTFEAQTAEPDRSIDKTVEEEFNKAQTILKRTGEALYNLGLVGVGVLTRSPQAVQGVQALRAKIEGKPFTPPTPNPNAPGIVNLEPITTEDAFTRPDMTGTGQQPEIEDVPQYPVVLQRILKVKKDNPGFFSNIINSIGKDNTQDDDDFGPEGPRGGATDEQIMQAYREVTGELQLNPNRVQETPKQLSLFEDGVERLDPTPNPNLPEYVTDAFRAATAEVTPRSGNPNLPGYMAAVGDSLIFRYKQFRNSIDGIRGADGRKFLELFQTPMSRMFAGQTTGDAKTFNTAKRAYQAKMRAAYDPVMDAMGLNLDKPFQFQMHHIAALKGVMGIFDGVGYDSQLHRAITDRLLTKLNGIGNMKENLMGVMGAVTDKDTTHYLAHLFLNDRIGKAGELFFTDDVLAKMAASDNFRLQKASELGDILLESELVARQADNVINTLYAQGKAIDPDVLFKNMEKLNDQGYLKGSLIDNKYQVQALPKLIENIIDLQDADAILNIDLVRIIGKGGQELKTLQKLFKYVEEGKTPPAKVINRIKNDGQQDLFRTTDQKLSDAMATWAEIYRRRTETLRKTLTRKNQELYFQDPDVTKPPT